VAKRRSRGENGVWLTGRQQRQAISGGQPAAAKGGQRLKWRGIGVMPKINRKLAAAWRKSRRSENRGGLSRIWPIAGENSAAGDLMAISLSGGENRISRHRINGESLAKKADNI
jgi:hypothetical protein